MAVTFRLAVPEDAEVLAEIYRPWVENTAVSFEYVAPSAEEFRNRIIEYSAEYPYIVCELDGECVGYAYAHRYKVRHAYRYAAELSVYLKKDVHGHGIGKGLYGALIELLTEMGCRNIYGIVTVPNPESFRLHEKMGFREVGREHLVGYKFGKWIDVAIFELCVGTKPDTDCEEKWFTEPLKISDLGEKVGEILKKHEKTASSD